MRGLKQLKSIISGVIIIGLVLGALLSATPVLYAQTDPTAQNKAEIEKLQKSLNNIDTSGISGQVKDLEKNVVSEINQMNFPKIQLKNEALKGITDGFAGISGRVNQAIGDLKNQLNNITGSIDDMKAMIAKTQETVINLFYLNPADLPDPPFEKLPWIEYVDPTKVGDSGALTSGVPKFAYCNSCCRQPQKIAEHLIVGGDPLGETSLQNYITGTVLPPILQSIKLLAPPISATALVNPVLEGNLRNAQMQRGVLDAQNQTRASVAMNQTVSNQVCRIASVSQSLGASDLYARTVQIALMDAARDRAFMRLGMSASVKDPRRAEGVSDIGQAADNAGRWHLYKRSFCNKQDPRLKNICTNADESMNDRDINFASATGYYRQLKINIAPPLNDRQSNTEFASKDLNAVIALSNNLYGHDLSFSVDDLKPSSYNFMDRRSLLAMRNVIQNSYTSYVAARASGNGGNADSLKALMAELKGEQGLAVQDDVFGARPSYEAQMDVLSRKLYQGQAFYKNLMDNPANIKRQQVAMQAVDLMNKHDIARSLERTEMLMALWLEIKLRREQAVIENRFNQSTGGQ